MYEVLEKLMKEKGVKASDAAKATGIPQSVFTDWKKGRYTPKADKLYVLAKYFGVSIESFFGDEEIHIEEERHYPNHEQTDFVMKLVQNKELYITVAQRLMGHSDIKMTAQIYTHHSQKSFEDARDKINAHVVQSVVQGEEMAKNKQTGHASQS